MKRSGMVSIGLLGTMASALLAIISCSSTEEWGEVCVDKNNVVVDTCECQKEELQEKRSTGGYVPYYHWYYMNMARGGSIPPIGSIASGGSYVRPIAPITGGKTVSISRGGFGSTGAGRSAIS